MEDNVLEFLLNKNSAKDDLLKFLSQIFENPQLNSTANKILISGTEIDCVFGKTYIRIASTDSSKVAILPYDKMLSFSKYHVSLIDICKLNIKIVDDLISVEKLIKENKIFVEKWLREHKYSYDPFVVDIKFKTVKSVIINKFDIFCEKNFCITCEKINDDLTFDVSVDDTLLNDLKPIGIKSFEDYLLISNKSMEKLQRIQKIITLIINDIKNFSV